MTLMTDIKLTENHTYYSLALRDKKMYPVVGYGSAGTGKTFGAMEFAAEWLSVKGRRLVCVRPNVSFADTLGFAPGSIREKLLPWIRPLSQALDMNGVSFAIQETLEKQGRLVYLPLEHVQGLSYDNTLLVVDECQHMTFKQFQVVSTRIGRYSKLVFCGDILQTSPKFHGSGLAEFIKMTDELNLPVHKIHFTPDDIVRSELCKMFINAFDAWGSK